MMMCGLVLTRKGDVMERKQLLTYSAQDAFKTCRRKYYHSYELGLRRIDESKALRMGSAGHSGVEAVGKGLGLEVACEAVRGHYENCPPHFDAYQWEIEQETMLRLVCAYDWRWKDAKIENIKTEFQFQMPLVNPATGAETPIWDLAGKIDGIVRLEDGRLAVKETKFLGEDIGQDSSLYRRLRRDSQISIYMIAARKAGFNVSTVLYDCIRKPAISATSVPFTDEDGIKIVLDANGQRVRNANGKTWRQTADTEKGYVLQSRPMTVSEWGEKLSSDIGERPDFYFQRTEVARLDDDLRETELELWSIQLAIREAQRAGRWFRTVGRNTCQFCAFDSICDRTLQPGEIPEGFEILSNPHPELSCESVKDVASSLCQNKKEALEPIALNHADLGIETNSGSITESHLQTNT